MTASPACITVECPTEACFGIVGSSPFADFEVPLRCAPETGCPVSYSPQECPEEFRSGASIGGKYVVFADIRNDPNGPQQRPQRAAPRHYPRTTTTAVMSSFFPPLNTMSNSALAAVE